MNLVLRYRTMDGVLHALELSRLTGPLVIGRDRTSARLVLADVHMSRAHCALSLVNGQAVLEDLGSRNGTWLNNEKVARKAVSPKDILTLGTSKMWIESPTEGFLVGHTLGGFELQDILGRGSYGTVYKGLQLALKRPVAIKVLDPRHKQDPEVVRNFLEEARRAGRLNHPQVVQVHDVVQTDGHHLLVMELMAGGSVANHLRSQGALSQINVLCILRDIGLALAYAESQALVHRDVKPDNILVNDEGVYKLADLGIAAPITEDGLAHQVRVFGSVHYVAPEQARGSNLDGRADIYALGATAYHLLAGRTLFDGTSREVINAHQRLEPTPLSEIVEALHPDLAVLIARMLAKDPSQRPASGKLVAEAAVTILDAVQSHSSTVVSEPATITRRRRRRMRPGGGAAVHRRRRR